MKAIKLGIGCLLMCVASLTTMASQISTAEVQTLLLSVEQGLKNKDADTVTNHFSPDASIMIDFLGNRGGKLALDRQGYKDRLTQTWSMPMSTVYQVSEPSIKMTDNGQSAIATHSVTERVEFDGEVIMTTISTETMTLKKINDALLIDAAHIHISTESNDQAMTE